MASPDSSIFETSNISYNCCPYYCSPCCPGYCFPFSPPPPFDLVSHDSDPTFSPLVIAIIGILASAFLLVFYYAILAKYCTNWESFRSRMRGGGYNDSYEDEDHILTPSNDSWPLVTIGLEESTIRSIPVYKYKRGDGLVECTDCSVCLSEFRDDDSVRLLPKCNHAFHLPCIDTWLHSHSNCPLCRANIVSPAASLPVEAAITIHDEGSDTTAVSQTPTDNHEQNSREEPMPSSLGNSSSANEINPNSFMERKEDTGKTEQETHMIELVMPSDVRALSDLASKHRRDDRMVGFGGDLQPMRRSVSVGSSSRLCISITDLLAMQSGFEDEDANAICPESSQRKRLGCELLVLKGFNKHLGQCQLKSKASGDASKSGILHNLKGPMTMKRSFSGGKFFLSRYHRGRSSILPI